MRANDSPCMEPQDNQFESLGTVKFAASWEAGVHDVQLAQEVIEIAEDVGGPLRDRRWRKQSSVRFDDVRFFASHTLRMVWESQCLLCLRLVSRQVDSLFTFFCWVMRWCSASAWWLAQCAVTASVPSLPLSFSLLSISPFFFFFFCSFFFLRFFLFFLSFVF